MIKEANRKGDRMMDDLYLYRQNFRKSKNFILPLAEIPAFPKGLLRSVKDVPLTTFVADEFRGITSEDCKLICVYQSCQDEEFKIHEHKYLISNRRFCDFYEKDGLLCYIIDLSDHRSDFKAAVSGKYTQLSARAKETIDKWHYRRMGNERFTPFLEFLYPNEQVYDKYATALKVDIDLLKEGVELCSPPDMKDETFSQENLDILLKGCNFAQTTT